MSDMTESDMTENKQHYHDYDTTKSIRRPT